MAADAALDLAALDALAQKATPGPWKAKVDEDSQCWHVNCTDGGFGYLTVAEMPPYLTHDDANAAYIAAVSPEVVRRMITALREAWATIRKEADNESALVQLDWCRARCERLERERNEARDLANRHYEAMHLYATERDEAVHTATNWHSVADTREGLLRVVRLENKALLLRVAKLERMLLPGTGPSHA